MDKYPFLSDEWFAAVDQATANFSGEPPQHGDIMLNVTIKGSPYGDKDVHMGSREAKPSWGLGHVDGADSTVTLDYDTARQLFIEGDMGAAISAFMGGKIVVQGDMTKLMSLQTSGAPGGALADEIRAFTK